MYIVSVNGYVPMNPFETVAHSLSDKGRMSVENIEDSDGSTLARHTLKLNAKTKEIEAMTV